MEYGPSSRWFLSAGLFSFIAFGFLGRGVYAGESTSGDVVVFAGNSRGAVACVVCHQRDGSGIPARGYPALAGLQEAYLFKQLREFKSGKRDHLLMSDTARALSEEEIVGAVRFFSALAPKPIPIPGAGKNPAAPKKLEAGEWIARYGRWERQVPACSQCHGKDGQGLGELFPPLVGQSESYLVQQLKAFKRGRRRNDPNSLMSTIAKRLTNKEIRAVAAFYSSFRVETEKEKKE